MVGKCGKRWEAGAGHLQTYGFFCLWKRCEGEAITVGRAERGLVQWSFAEEWKEMRRAPEAVWKPSSLGLTRSYIWLIRPSNPLVLPHLAIFFVSLFYRSRPLGASLAPPVYPLQHVIPFSIKHLPLPALLPPFGSDRWSESRCLWILSTRIFGRSTKHSFWAATMPLLLVGCLLSFYRLRPPVVRLGSCVRPSSPRKCGGYHDQGS